MLGFCSEVVMFMPLYCYYVIMSGCSHYQHNDITSLATRRSSEISLIKREEKVLNGISRPQMDSSVFDTGNHCMLYWNLLFLVCCHVPLYVFL